MHERRLQPDLAQWIVQGLSRLLATYAVFQGVAIVLGGVYRWQGPSFTTALTFPGAPESWGVVLAGLGSFALAGTFTPHMRTTAILLGGIGAWAFFLAATFVVAFGTIPGAATTGIFAYGHQGVAACVLAVAYWKSRR